MKNFLSTFRWIDNDGMRRSVGNVKSDNTWNTKKDKAYDDLENVVQTILVQRME